jgi:uncharacterized protein with HEPN domain
MLQAARSALEFVVGLSAQAYLESKLARRAVEREFEILGEAARRVSDELKTAHPEIPWQGLVGLRNVISHEYGEVKHERIWVVLESKLPVLVKQLEGLVPELPEGP